MVRRILYIGSMLCIIGSILVSLNYCKGKTVKKDFFIKPIHDISQVVELFMLSPGDIRKNAEKYMKQAKQELEKVIAIPEADRTYANTAQQLDRIIGLSQLYVLNNLCEGIELLHPDKAMRDAAHETSIKIHAFWVDEVSNNKALYYACKEYAEGNAQKEELTASQKYFIEETMKDFERAGLNLPDEELNEVKKLRKKIVELSQQFDRNIADDHSTVVIDKAGLKGLPEDFIGALKKDTGGKYILGMDYPTFFTVMENCAVSDTREKMMIAFENRAYPENDKLLKEIIVLRDQLAKKLGFASFAHLDLADQMVKTPEHAESFIQDLIKKSEKKAHEEITLLTKDLPESVALTADGKIKLWDFSFLKSEYKKKNYQIDELEIQKYFPMEHTIEQLLDIYRQFMGVEFEEVPVTGLWHEDVKAVKVYNADKSELHGFLLLDLYPRPNKFNHAAELPAISGVLTESGKIPTVSIVIANFPRPSADKPSLLKRSDVSTFFHEFGHAIHDLLGATPIASLSGAHTKRDFVELPSQMLEEWLYDKKILQKVTKHYQTGEALPEDVIDKLISLKKLTTGNFVQRQSFLSMIALDYYKAGAHKDLFGIMKQLHEDIRDTVQFDSRNHFYASFGHLTGYAAKYYGYLWSKVFAQDIFSEIKKHGLLNHAIGKKYVDEILGKGGSLDPNILLRNFLGREPNNKAFLEDMGLV